MKTASTALVSFLEALPDAAYLKNADGSLFLCNNAFSEQFSKNKINSSAPPPDCFFDQETNTLLNCKERELSSAGDKTKHKFMLPTAGGAALVFEQHLSLIKHPDDDTILTLSIFKDISEETRLENELYIQSEKYNVLLESLPVGISITDDTGNLIELNRFGEKLLGVKKLEHFQRTYDGKEWKIIRPDGTDMPADEYASAIAFKENIAVQNVEMGILKPDEVTWLNVSAAPIPLKNYGVAISYFDITSKILYGKKLQELKAQFENLYNNMNEGFFIVEVVFDDNLKSTDYYHRNVNDAFEKQTGIKRAGILDKRISEVFPGNAEFEQWIPIYGNIITRNTPIHLENYVESSKKTFAISAYPAGGNFVGVLINDITQRKEDENRLRKAMSDAKEMSKLKSDFLANMSHELRTPMNGILGLAQIMKRYADNDRLKSLSKKILDSGKRLMDTLNSILDLSILENSRLEVNWENIAFDEYVKKNALKFEDSVKEKNLELFFSLPQKPVYISSDTRLLNHVCNTLFHNAIKFSKKGIITITVSERKLNGKDFAVLQVSDMGIGIKPENFDIIFKAFRQASEGQSRNYEGMGLGLTIAKKIVEFLEGKIEVESELHKGSTFTISLPIEPKLISKAGPTDRPRNKIPNTRKTPSDKKVLIIEDNLTNIEVMQMFLEGICTAECATTPSEALSLIKAKSFDALLMDINLGMGNDGLRLTRKIREIPGYQKTPIIAVTGYALSGDKETFLSAGLTHYIPKPFLEKDFVDLVSSVLV